MSKDLKKIVESVTKNDLIIGISLFLILVLLGQYRCGYILLIGLIVSIINFIISSIITDKLLNNPKKNKAILFPLSYLIRIISIVAIAIVFSNKISNLLAFLTGFIMHYFILVITTITSKEGK